jgi:hypothetical protein
VCFVSIQAGKTTKAASSQRGANSERSKQGVKNKKKKDEGRRK